MSFRKRYPAAWIYHHNTVRWPFNTLEPAGEGWPGAAFKEHPNAPLVALPAARRLEVSLQQAVEARVSCRNFRAAPLALSDLAALLWLGNGVAGRMSIGAREYLERTVPSGGGLYPLELYVIARNVDGLEAGVYHYVPLHHGLERLQSIEIASSVLSQLFMNQPYIANAGGLLVISAIVERTMHKYADRGYRYVLLEAGHCAQNICLGAAALNLGALPLGGFFDGYLASLLKLDLEEEIILYGLATGHPATEDRMDMRNVAALVPE